MVHYANLANSNELVPGEQSIIQMHEEAVARKMRQSDPMQQSQLLI